MDFKNMQVVKEIKPTGQISQSFCDIMHSKYLLIFSIDLEENSIVDIFDLNDYSKVFTFKREDLCKIIELKCGNFVLSYSNGKMEIASIDLKAKTINVLQEFKEHKSTIYDVKELSNGNLVSCSDENEIIFWCFVPKSNVYEKLKYLNTNPDQYATLLEDSKRNKLICAQCFESNGTCIIDLTTYEIIAKFNDVQRDGASDIYFVNDKIVIDVCDENDNEGLFFIDMDKNQIVKHDKEFNNNNSTCFLKLANGNLLCSVVARGQRNSESDDEDYEEGAGRTDIQCWEIDETGLNWKLLYTRENIDAYPIISMIQLGDGRIAAFSNVLKIYQ